MLVLCWPKLALRCPMLTLCWPQLPLSCPYVDPMFAYVGLRNANPHGSDRKGGGDDGVTTGDDGVRPTRSAAGAARLYPGAGQRPKSVSLPEAFGGNRRL